MLNRFPAFEVQALRPVASISHSFSGDVAVPGSLQLRPTMASGMAFWSLKLMCPLTAGPVEELDLRPRLVTVIASSRSQYQKRLW